MSNFRNWRLAFLAVFALVLSLAVVSLVHAAPARPLTVYTSNAGSHFKYTIANVNGLFTSPFDEPINPSTCNLSNNSQCYFATGVSYKDSSGNEDGIRLEVAYTANSANWPFSPYCDPNTNNTDQEFIFYFHRNSSGVIDTSGCQDVPATDRGGIINLLVNNYASNGGGVQFEADDGVSGDLCSYASCFFGLKQVTPTNQYYVGEHQVVNAGGLSKLTNSTVQGDINGYLIGSTGHDLTTDASPVASNPPWMGWVSGEKPSQSTSGGTYYTCSEFGTSTNPC